MKHRILFPVIALCAATAVLIFSSGCAKRETAKTQTEHFEGDGHDHSGHDHAKGDGHDHSGHAHTEGDGHDHSSSEKQPQIAGVDWCPQHRAPGTQCTRCHPELAEGFKAKNDWCKDHQFPDTHCLACNPAIRFSEEEQYKIKAAEGKRS